MAYYQLLVCSIILAILNPSFSDIYLHNPRGTNNRHNETNPERANPNLNFDSQNNNRGGYNVGDDGAIYYYAKSILPIQWTNQHSCNDVNADCALLLQYTCDPSLRDGQRTTRILVTAAAENDKQYRLTEDLSSYLHCRVRSQDTNLFTADQKLAGKSAIYTRQNPKGDQYGYECPEERDYYPHWQPNKWIDIAVLTNRQDLCSYYRDNSQNVKPRFACTFSNKNDIIKANDQKIILPNNQVACEAFNDTRMGRVKPVWTTFSQHNVPPPECYTPSYTRENHLGDVRGSEMSVYNWTLPDIVASKCVLRIRYNITTSDYDAWNISASKNGNNLLIMRKYFANDTVTANRGYLFKNNPQVQLFDGMDMPLQLAINTAQFSRVFQDRSFTFEIRKRTAELANRPIYNLNVRGRRGNIVQVFPAVEYDFVPNRLEMPPNSYVHIQWIGSNTTPPGDGQGKIQNDRNNLLMLRNTILDTTWRPYEYLNSTGLLSVNMPENLNSTNFLNMPLSTLRLLASSNSGSDPELNTAKAYFNLEPQLVTAESAGVYHYVSTRNNDFSNRDQKGRITVQPFEFQYQLLGLNGYTATLGNAIITFPEGSVTQAVSIKYGKFTIVQLPEIIPENGQNIATKLKLFQDVYVIEPYDLSFAKQIEFQIPFAGFDGNEKKVDVFQFEPRKGVYLKLPTSLDNTNRMLKFQSDTAGIYVFAHKQSSPLWVIGVIVPVVLVLLIVISTVIYFRYNPQRYTQVKEQVSKSKRSVLSKL